MTIINSNDTNFKIEYKIISEGVYRYKVPLNITKNGDTPFNIGEVVYVCETGSGYGFGISKENNFTPGYYDRDSCRKLIIE